MLVAHNYIGGDNILTFQPEDGRNELWLDPRKLYRLHSQTVKVDLEETSEPCSPTPDIAPCEPGVTALDLDSEGNRSFQVKKVDLDRVRIEPKVQRLGDGIFMLSTDYEEGESVDFSPKG